MQEKDGGGGGLFAQARRDLAAAKAPAKDASADKRPAGKAGARPAGGTASKRVTPPKNAPTPSARTGKPPSSGRAGRPGGPSQRPKKK
jgi:hypothetical protein